MKKLYVVKHGLQNNGCRLDSNGEQIKNTYFYLLTFGKGNEGYIKKKSANHWLLYTQIGELEKLRHLNTVGSSDKSRIRYHHFSTFKECIERLKELCVGSLVVFSDSDSFPSSSSSEIIFD